MVKGESEYHLLLTQLLGVGRLLGFHLPDKYGGDPKFRCIINFCSCIISKNNFCKQSFHSKKKLN